MWLEPNLGLAERTPQGDGGETLYKERESLNDPVEQRPQPTWNLNCYIGEK